MKQIMKKYFMNMGLFMMMLHVHSLCAQSTQKQKPYIAGPRWNNGMNSRLGGWGYAGSYQYSLGAYRYSCDENVLYVHRRGSDDFLMITVKKIKKRSVYATSEHYAQSSCERDTMTFPEPSAPSQGIAMSQFGIKHASDDRDRGLVALKKMGSFERFKYERPTSKRFVSEISTEAEFIERDRPVNTWQASQSQSDIPVLNTVNTQKELAQAFTLVRKRVSTLQKMYRYKNGDIVVDPVSQQPIARTVSIPRTVWVVKFL